MNTPFDFKQMLEEMNKQLEETTQLWSGEQPQLSSRRFPVDIIEDEDELVVTAEMPGFEREDIDITVTERTLWVEAQNEEQMEEEADQYHRKERRATNMKRSIRLPTPVLTEEASAALHNGVLTLTLPKAHSDEDSHRIEIQTS